MPEYLAADLRLEAAIAQALELLEAAAAAPSLVLKRALADGALSKLLDALPTEAEEEAEAEDRTYPLP